MTDLVAYAGLFGAALAAASILEAPSEAVVVGLLLADAYSPALLLLVASAGNTGGSATNSLLLSWVPVVGDPLTVAAGIMRESFPMFLLLVALANSGRYVAVVALTLGWV